MRDGNEGRHRPIELPHPAALSLGPTRFAGRPHRQWLDFQHDVTVCWSNLHE